MHCSVNPPSDKNLILSQHTNNILREKNSDHNQGLNCVRFYFLQYFFSLSSFPAFTAELNINQHVTAEQMREIVLIKAVTQRIVEMCADFSTNDARLNSRRDFIMAVAKDKFASGPEFINASR